MMVSISFATLHRKIRIDRDDADFVDIIHTDAGDFDTDEFMSVLGMVSIVDATENLFDLSLGLKNTCSSTVPFSSVPQNTEQNTIHRQNRIRR